jgi:hypothetical protein
MLNLLNFPHNLKEMVDEEPNTVYPASLTEWIALFRQENEITDEKLTLLLGINRTELKALEEGRSISPETEERLKKLFAL